MYYIGIDLGGTNIAAGITDESFNLIKKASVPTHAERNPDEIIADMGKLCNDLVLSCGLTLDEIGAAGIAAPGAIDPVNGVVTYAPNLPFLDYPLAERLSKHLNVKNIYVENDANAAALGEAMSGAAKGAKYSVMLTLGTGVGGGVIIDGKIYTGFNYAGAELGHTVIEYNGRQCGCGRKGCLEAYASATALINMTKEKLAVSKDSLMWDGLDGDLSKVNGKTAFAAARKGDKAGKEVVDAYIGYLACGVTTMINIFQPEVLTIGGGVCNEGDYLMKPIIEIADREQFTSHNKVKTVIKRAALGNDAGIIGAAALVKSRA